MGTGRWLALHTMAEQGKVVGGQLYSGGSCTYALRQDEKRRLPLDRVNAMQARWAEVILKGQARKCGPLDTGTRWQAVLGCSPGRGGIEANS